MKFKIQALIGAILALTTMTNDWYPHLNYWDYHDNHNINHFIYINDISNDDRY
jgi:hypothetical protein